MLQLETIERVARVTPTISALLAGFSFTMVRGLMFHSEKPALTNAALLSFLASAAAMLVVTFTATYCLVLIALSTGQAVEPVNVARTETIIQLTKWIFNGGLLCHLVGIGLLGWLHSKRVGMIAVAIVVVAGSLMLGTIIFLGARL